MKTKRRKKYKKKSYRKKFRKKTFNKKSYKKKTFRKKLLEKKKFIKSYNNKHIKNYIIGGDKSAFDDLTIPKFDDLEYNKFYQRFLETFRDIDTTITQRKINDLYKNIFEKAYKEVEVATKEANIAKDWKNKMIEESNTYLVKVKMVAGVTAEAMVAIKTEVAEMVDVAMRADKVAKETAVKKIEKLLEMMYIKEMNNESQTFNKFELLTKSLRKMENIAIDAQYINNIIENIFQKAHKEAEQVEAERAEAEKVVAGMGAVAMEKARMAMEIADKMSDCLETMRKKKEEINDYYKEKKISQAFYELIILKKMLNRIKEIKIDAHRDSILIPVAQPLPEPQPRI